MLSLECSLQKEARRQDIGVCEVPGQTHAEVNDETFWAELPAALRTDMALELARPLFKHSDIFRALDASAERLVATRLQPCVVPAGHNVAQEGDDADALYLLQEGAAPSTSCHDHFGWPVAN